MNNPLVNDLIKEIENINIEKSNIDKIVIEIGEIKSKILEKKYGIINICNSCYINASLQIFFHNEFFVENFINNFNLIKLNENGLSKQLLNTLEIIYSINTLNNNIFLDIGNIINIFTKKHNEYSPYVQNDAHEFIRLFLEDLISEFNLANNIYIYKNFEYNENDNIFNINNNFDSFYKKKENSFLNNIIYCQIINL